MEYCLVFVFEKVTVCTCIHAICVVFVSRLVGWLFFDRFPLSHSECWHRLFCRYRLKKHFRFVRFIHLFGRSFSCAHTAAYERIWIWISKVKGGPLLLSLTIFSAHFWENKRYRIELLIFSCFFRIFKSFYQQSINNSSSKNHPI